MQLFRRNRKTLDRVSRHVWNEALHGWDPLPGHSPVYSRRLQNELWNDWIPNVRASGVDETQIMRRIAVIRNHLLRGMLIERYVLDFDPESHFLIRSDFTYTRQELGLE